MKYNLKEVTYKLNSAKLKHRIWYKPFFEALGYENYIEIRKKFKQFNYLHEL